MMFTGLEVAPTMITTSCRSGDVILQDIVNVSLGNSAVKTLRLGSLLSAHWLLKYSPHRRCAKEMQVDKEVWSSQTILLRMSGPAIALDTLRSAASNVIQYRNFILLESKSISTCNTYLLVSSAQGGNQIRSFHSI